MAISETIIESPCVRNCCLDKQDVCLGCGRAVDEIIIWGEATNQQKCEILKRAEKRRADRKSVT